MIGRLSDTVPPLTPDGDQARRWAQQELSDPAYAQARPTPLDRLARAVQEFFERLFGSGGDQAWGLWIAVLVAVILLALIVVAVIASGRPRRSRRAAAVPAELFGDVETRSAAQLRRAAEAAAAAVDWPEAIILRQRALARGLVERGAVDLAPGVTVHGFARAASRALPDLAGDLDSAAAAFDDVRYLRRPGSAGQYRIVADTDDAVSAHALPNDSAPAAAGSTER